MRKNLCIKKGDFKMKEVKVTMYEANDGKLFDTKENCLMYEYKEVLKTISEICIRRGDCNDCPFFKEGAGCILNRFPENWSAYL